MWKEVPWPAVHPMYPSWQRWAVISLIINSQKSDHLLPQLEKSPTSNFYSLPHPAKSQFPPPSNSSCSHHSCSIFVLLSYYFIYFNPPSKTCDSPIPTPYRYLENPVMSILVNIQGLRKKYSTHKTLFWNVSLCGFFTSQFHNKLDYSYWVN